MGIRLRMPIQETGPYKEFRDEFNALKTAFRDFESGYKPNNPEHPAIAERALRDIELIDQRIPYRLLGEAQRHAPIRFRIMGREQKFDELVGQIRRMHADVWNLPRAELKREEIMDPAWQS